jgi:hypothetical protein
MSHVDAGKGRAGHSCVISGSIAREIWRLTEERRIGLGTGPNVALGILSRRLSLAVTAWQESREPFAGRRHRATHTAAG